MVGPKDVPVFGSSRPPVLLRALVLGFGGGLRSWPPLALLALNYDTPSFQGGWKRWPVFRSIWGRRLLIALAVAEFVADKLPNTQSRLDLIVQLSRTDGGLVGRVAADTLAGAVLGSTRPGTRDVAEGAAFAAAGAWSATTSATTPTRPWTRELACPIPSSRSSRTRSRSPCSAPWPGPADRRTTPLT